MSFALDPIITLHAVHNIDCFISKFPPHPPEKMAPSIY